MNNHPDDALSLIRRVQAAHPSDFWANFALAEVLGRRKDPDAIDRVVRKYAGALGLDRGYSAHSMRATFITTALENGAQLEDVQKAGGHRDPSTTKLYDRRGYNPEKAASFFATY